MINGYNTLDLTAKTVYIDALDIAKSKNKKPTFIFDGTNTTAIQTIVLNNDNTITINGELTIATDGTLTPNDYEIKTPHLHLYRINISGIFNSNSYTLLMLIYSTKDLKTGVLSITDINEIDEISNYEYTPIYDTNNNATESLFFENLNVENDTVFCNIYTLTNGEITSDDGVAIRITKLF